MIGFDAVTTKIDIRPNVCYCSAMTRPILESFIAQVGIIDASIMLHRYPITLERWGDGQDQIPLAVAEWLAEWAAGSPATDLNLTIAADRGSSSSGDDTLFASIRI